MIAIISAMQVENDAILALCENVKEKVISNRKFYEATLNGEKVVCCLSGIGKVNAAITTTVLIEHFPVDYILNIGTAGGLKVEEEVLDCVISTRVVEHDYDTSHLDGDAGKGLWYDADPLLINITKDVATEMNIPFHVGLVASGDQFITKETSQNILGFYKDACCAEMEAGSIGHVASNYGVPFVVIRSLSDIAVKEFNSMEFSEYCEKASVRSAIFCQKCVARITKK